MVFLLLFSFSFSSSHAQTKLALSYTVSMEEPATHSFHVILKCEGIKSSFIDFKMPVWSPGYYQRMDFAKNVENFKATGADGKEIKWEKISDNDWHVSGKNLSSIFLNYDVKTSRPFVGSPYLDEERGYIVPAAVFVHIDKKIQQPVTIIIKPNANWKNVATGLDSVKGKPFTYWAPDFDILYDSPILIGNLEELTPFTINGIPHRFIGYKLGEFDRVSFMSDLKKIVETATSMIGDIPYKHYTFLAIGPGAGGIEHLNSTTISFSGAGLASRQSRIRTMHFIAHEYFHHYNVKRIRPIELGPFDYDNGNRTKMLWVSEGLSVYYEYLLVKRAGISTEEELLNAFRQNIINYENKPGRLFQTLAQSSYETWSDGPFGRTGDEVNKTISYYDKGPAVGMLLDFAIRHETNNKRSLDDVMRRLYQEFYQKKKRGFTEDEFRKVCEEIAGRSLDDIFDYVYSTKEVNYKKYFDYADLDIDTTSREIPGGWLGTTVRERNDSLFINAVDWESPAWNAGLRPRDIILEVDGAKAKTVLVENILKEKKPGDKVVLAVLQGKEIKNFTVTLGQKIERSFEIERMSGPNVLQAEILRGWLDGK